MISLIIPDCHVREIQATFLQFTHYETQRAAGHHGGTGLIWFYSLTVRLFTFAFRFALNFVTEEVINPQRYVKLGSPYHVNSTSTFV